MNGLILAIVSLAVLQAVNSHLGRSIITCKHPDSLFNTVALYRYTLHVLFYLVECSDYVLKESCKCKCYINGRAK